MRDDLIIWMQNDELDRFANGKEFDKSTLPGVLNFRLKDIEVSKSDEFDSDEEEE